ncbi:hypothetical protein MFIFM68171_11310 [Madurella fahalii]|uniref:Alpha/beta hydrolase fold-3 domain-containing protein n=1 Tax=Madurella fahalii TaxID=1157608 RepID=A0ABQ0GTN3_9PEZI
MAARRPDQSVTEELTIWDSVAFAWLFPLVVGRWLVYYTFCKNAVLHWRQRLALTFLQAQRANFPTRHLRWLVRHGSTRAAIQRYCDRHSIPHKTTTLDATSTSDNPSLSIPPPTLHMLTPNTPHGSGSTLFYLHGGGYVNPLRGAAHCLSSCSVPPLVMQRKSSFSTALRYLVEGMSVQPEDVILAGDSAGGQLVAALLAHLARPSPYAAPLVVRGQFRAALLVSPFTRLPTDAGSYESNDGKDYLSRAQVAGFKAAWKGREDEVWANLCGGGGAAEIWKEVFAGSTDGLVKKHVGAEMVMAGCDTDWRVLEGKTSVLVECEGEVHVQVAVDYVVGYGRGTMLRAIMAWLLTTNS